MCTWVCGLKELNLCSQLYTLDIVKHKGDDQRSSGSAPPHKSMIILFQANISSCFPSAIMNTYHCCYCIWRQNVTDLLFIVIHNMTVLMSITRLHFLCARKKQSSKQIRQHLHTHSSYILQRQYTLSTFEKAFGQEINNECLFSHTHRHTNYSAA